MTNMQNVPCADEVFARVKAGEVIRLDASYSYQSRFDDGTTVPHQVMQTLVYNDSLLKPAQRGDAWVVSQAKSA